MQISGTKTFASLRQLSTSNRGPDNATKGQMDQRLVFAFPILVDSSLTKYANLCRDFLSVEVISQVKTSNMLNIMTKISYIGRTIQSSKSATPLNPTQEVLKSMNNLGYYSPYNLPSNDIPYDTRIYQEKINQFLGFIRNQLEHDPRYNKMRPLISSITLEENLLQLPLIVGTKMYPVNDACLYWILMGALLNRQFDITTENGVNQIIQYLKNIPEERFASLMFSDEGRDRLTNAMTVKNDFMNTASEKPDKPSILGKAVSFPYNMVRHPFSTTAATFSTAKNATKATYSAVKHPLKTTSNTLSAAQNNAYIPNNRSAQQMQRMQRVGLNIKTELDKTKIFLGLATNYRKWAAETNYISNDHYVLDTITTVDESPEQRNSFIAATNAFSTYCGIILRPFINSMEKLLGPIPFDITDKARTLIDTLNDNLQTQFWELSKHVRTQITYSNQDMTNDAKVNNYEQSMKSFEQICQRNASQNTLSGIKKLLLHDLIDDLEVNVNFTGENLVKFVDKITSVGIESESRLKGIQNEITRALPDKQDFDTSFNNVREIIRNALETFIFKDSPGTSNSKLFDNSPRINFRDRHQYWFSYICNGTNEGSCRTYAAKIMNELHGAMTNILSFLFIWTFLSYLCEYLREIDIDVTLRKRDITDFPNYCMVLPMYIIKNLYMLLTSQNVKNVILKGETADGDVFPDMGNIKRVVELVNKQLKIPNLIVIDEKSGDFIYCFMYMDKPISIKLNSVESYVEHQHDVLQGF